MYCLVVFFVWFFKVVVGNFNEIVVKGEIVMNGVLLFLLIFVEIRELYYDVFVNFV